MATDVWPLWWEALLGEDAPATQVRREERAAMEDRLLGCQDRLYRFLLRLTGDTALAEDLFQQTWIRALERPRRFDPRRPFENWLLRVARNLAIDELRRRRPESLDEPLPSGGDRASALVAPGGDALDALLARERAETVRQVLASLPFLYREVLVLRFEEDMKLDEIALVIGAPTPTIKSRLARGLATLRRELLKRSAEDRR